jgi:cytochrome b pre-mRNA-processing protein 3
MIPFVANIDCYLPPTFQSWFTITNLHVWLLTVRLRALPADSGKPAVQGLIDHFFLDVEDRIRYVLQPHPLARLPANSSFYSIPELGEGGEASQKQKGKAPERIVTQQMKIFKEQWAGMGMAFDLGLVKGDMEMAGAIWRNLLGARGARGIVFPDSPPSTSTPSPADSAATKPYFRRSINLVGGSDSPVKQLEKRGLESEEARDDGSGVHDFAPQEADKYVKYPEVMGEVVGYVRRELSRLDRVEDSELLEGDLSRLKFGSVRDDSRKL